ncbi:Uncharacterised protein [Klebsiella pneumoniae]|nr:Uncharacterised protein [Klebsiella pneumoniae]SWW25407.1 Uncharacterised protein [Klebsiella pneumoniae]SWW45123.1 Uncharacterised protein [Klebsiella pneumoniae]SWW71024.1 Uncharacterised protein [Klebsiella pneumoniae]
MSAGSMVWRAKRECFFMVGALGDTLPFADMVNFCKRSAVAKISAYNATQ